ncbi:MAG: glycerol-3-phosphate acyltransferase [Acidimicrobiia bacterium]
MSAAAAFLVGLGIGSIPSADLWARIWGVDLRGGGTGNPGTRNALQVGGRTLAALILATELVKGAGAVWLGISLAGDPGGAAAGVAATLGNVYNPWYGLQGGKGLAISGGIILAAWPYLLPLIVMVLLGTVILTRRSGPAALASLVLYVAASVAALFIDLPHGWGLGANGWLVFLAVGSAVVIAPKHIRDTLRPAGPTPSRGGS